jgi:gliding motility-associated-like protein
MKTIKSLLLTFLSCMLVYGISAQQTIQVRKSHAENTVKSYFSSSLLDDLLMQNYAKRSFEFKFQNKSFVYDFMGDVINLYVEGNYDFDTIHQHFTHHLELHAAEINLIAKPTKGEAGTNHITKQYNGPCVNMDFEEGTLNGWEMFEGSVNNNPYEMVGATQIGAAGPHHTIMGPGTDPVVGIPTVNPNGGGNFSLRLGDGTVPNYGAASIRQSFLVDANNAAFIYSYAVVLENPSSDHSQGEMPFFKINMFDESNNIIQCGEYAVIPGGSGANANWITQGGIDYLPWTTTFAPLDDYIGQNVTIEFVVGDCSLGAHYGYAYVDATCNPLEIITSSPAICDNEAITLSAPAGAATYLWNTGETTQEITTATPGNYWVELTPITGNGCQLTLTITVDGVTGTAVTDFDVAPAAICIGDQIQLTDQSTGTNGSTIDAWEWNFGDGTVVSNQQSLTHTFGAAGTYDVQLVTSVMGCSDTLIQQVVVQDDPVPSFTAPAVCQGTATQFTNTSTIASGTITGYEWDYTSNGIVNSTNTNTSHGFPQAGTYDVTLTATTSNGCSNSVTQQVVVNSVPVVAFTPEEVCQGATTEFEDLSSVVNGTITDWFWDFGDGGATSNLQNPTYTYPNSGSYNVSLTVTSDQGCISTGTQLIDVYAVPTANFTVVNACDGQAVVFTNASADNGGSNVSFDWDYTNDGTVDFTGTTTSHIYPAPGAYTASLTVTNSNGCSDNIVLPLDVFASPTASFTGENICAGGDVQFTNTSSVQIGTITGYNWDFANGLFSTQQSPSSVYANEGIYQVALTVTSSNGCTNETTVPITIYPNPVATFLTSDVCDGQTASFMNASTVSNQFSTNNITSFEWNFGITPGVNATGQFPTNNYVTPGTYNVTLNVTTNNGCTGSVTQPITIHPNPTVNFTSPNPMGCTEWCVNFENNVVVTSGNITEYVWNFGDGFATTEANPSHCYVNNTLTNQSFTVSLNVTTDQGCTGSFTAPNFVTVYPAPVALFEADPAITDIYNPIVNFTNQSLLNTTNNWDFGGLGTSTLLNPTFTFPDDDAGIYTVCLDVTSVNGCVHEYCSDVIVQGISSVYVPNAFTPNGDGKNELFFPVLFGISAEEYQFMVFDRWGMLIYETDSHSGAWDGTHNGLPSQQDVYVWKLKAVDKYTEEVISHIGHVSLIR